MKFSTRIALLLFALATALGASAQFRYAAIAGPSITSLTFKQDLVDLSAVPGFQAGVQGEMMFPGIGFGIDLGLIYNMAGAKVNLGQRTIWANEGYGNEHLTIHQINIPLHLRFKYTRLNGLEETFAPFVYGGPDINIAVGHSHCDAIKFAGGDFGLTAGIGAEIFTRWQVSASYTWGMTYALKTRLLQDFSAKNRQWSLRVAYFF